MSSVGDENPLDEGDEKLNSASFEGRLLICCPEPVVLLPPCPEPLVLLPPCPEPVVLLLPPCPERLGLVPYEDVRYFCDCLTLGGFLTALVCDLLLGCPAILVLLFSSSELFWCLNSVLKPPCPEDKPVLVGLHLREEVVAVVV